jgi:hypothetical protein
MNVVVVAGCSGTLVAVRLRRRPDAQGLTRDLP